MIKVENLRKTFGERLLFDSASLKIERGDFVGIYGPSGSGKTTLLSLLSLSDPDYGGLIEIDGQDLRELRGRERPSFALRNVARVYGENNLVDYLTARENALPLRGDSFERSVADWWSTTNEEEFLLEIICPTKETDPGSLPVREF